MSQPTNEQLKAGMQTLIAVSTAIRDLKQVPTGHLYATLMSKMDLPTFNRVVATLKRADVVREADNVLHWIAA